MSHGDKSGKATGEKVLLKPSIHWPLAFIPITVILGHAEKLPPAVKARLQPREVKV